MATETEVMFICGTDARRRYIRIIANGRAIVSPHWDVGVDKTDDEVRQTMRPKPQFATPCKHAIMSVERIFGESSTSSLLSR